MFWRVLSSEIIHVAQRKSTDVSKESYRRISQSRNERETGSKQKKLRHACFFIFEPENGGITKKEKQVLGRTNCRLSSTRHGPHRKRRFQQFFYVFVTVVTILPSRCLATIRGFLPSGCLATVGGYTYRNTDWWEEFFNYAIEIGSGAVIYISSFKKIGSGIQKLIGG
jgi:hypothetical protein